MFELQGRIFAEGDPDCVAALAKAYQSQERPRCRCMSPGIEMYIARLRTGYIVKRMPNTGHRHASSCSSYEPPPDMSGLGELLGTAIRHRESDEVTTLALDFPMSKAGNRRAGTAIGNSPVSVRGRRVRMSLRAVLHYLLDQAGLGKWTPAMAGKRSWVVVRSLLRKAAEGKEAKRLALASQLFIPESFFLADKEAIARRRQLAFAQAKVGASGAQRLMLLIAEVKEFARARIGHKMVVKHMPDAPFAIDNDLHDRLFRVFAKELALWNHLDGAHLLAAATFGVDAAGVAKLDALTLMVTNEHWHGIETLDEKSLLDTLIARRRRFMKTFRYDLPPDARMATAVLVDCDGPVYLFMSTADAGSKEQPYLLDDGGTPNGTLWTWQVGLPMPNLPEPAIHP
jgi:hypothetical protein